MSRSKAADRLDSWKAIARHINRSERTARRWEAEEGMPVHRHKHQSLASVYAYVTEIDAWLVRWESKDDLSTELPSPARKNEQSSIAVLPFDFIGSDLDDGYIADGFTDEIIADLAKIGSLRVISRTSMMQLKGSSLAIGELAKKLDVEYLLEGSVRRFENAIKASVRLIEPYRERQVWSEKYSGGIQDVFEIQERIARDVAMAMKLRITAADETRLANRNITDWLAWRAAVAARQASWRWTKGGIDKAQAILEDSLASAGEDAYLLAALGKTLLHRREAGFDLSEGLLLEVQRCADRAFAADSDGGAGFELRGWLHYSRGEIQQAVDNLKAAYERQGSNPDVLGLLCNCYLISGQVPVARSLIPQVCAMDPLSPVLQALPAWADVLEGRHSDAISVYRQTLQQEPESPILRMLLVWILAINGLPDEVAAVVDGFADRDIGSLPAMVARCFKAACEGAVPNVEISSDDRELASINDMYPRMFAQAYALAGEPDAAIEWLTLAVSRGFINYPYLKYHDPLMKRLDRCAEYHDLLKDVNRRWSEFVV